MGYNEWSVLEEETNSGMLQCFSREKAIVSRFVLMIWSRRRMVRWQRLQMREVIKDQQQSQEEGWEQLENTKFQLQFSYIPQDIL